MLLVDSEVVIGKHTCRISRDADGYFLTISHHNNSDIIRQFGLDTKGLGSRLGLVLDYSGGFPYHSTLNDLEITIKYLQALTVVKNSVKPGTNCSNLVHKRIIWDVSPRSDIKQGSFDVILEAIPGHKLVFEKYGSVLESRLTSNHFRILPTVSDVSCSLHHAARLIKCSITGGIFNIHKVDFIDEICTTTERVKLRDYGYVSFYQFINGNIEILDDTNINTINNKERRKAVRPSAFMPIPVKDDCFSSKNNQVPTTVLEKEKEKVVSIIKLIPTIDIKKRPLI